MLLVSNPIKMEHYYLRYFIKSSSFKNRFKKYIYLLYLIDSTITSKLIIVIFFGVFSWGNMILFLV